MRAIPRRTEIGEFGTWWCHGPHVMLSCPECGYTSRLDHTVASDGTVTPSVVCPLKDCSFHEHVKLTDWDGGEVGRPGES